MTKRTLVRLALLAVSVSAVSGTAFAQAVRGTLLGTVHDTQGAPVAAVNVTAVETQTNISRSVVTNASGNTRANRDAARVPSTTESPPTVWPALKLSDS
jgi:hypothetical protein